MTKEQTATIERLTLALLERVEFANPEALFVVLDLIEGDAGLKVDQSIDNGDGNTGKEWAIAQEAIAAATLRMEADGLERS